MVNVNSGIPWNVLFIVVLWNIWCSRNRLVFDNVICDIPTVVCDAFKPTIRSQTKDVRLLKWNFPGCVKLMRNTDGSSTGNLARQALEESFEREEVFG